jgi:hypothetical protein
MGRRRAADGARNRQSLTGHHLTGTGRTGLSGVGDTSNADYDVCVLFSGDTDLPAIEAVLALGKRCEVAPWKGTGRWSSRLRVQSTNLWCHWFEQGDYDNYLHDPTDYTHDAGTPTANP